MPRGRKPKHAIVMTKYIRGPKTVYWVEGMPSDFIEDDGRNILLHKEDGTKLEMSYLGSAFKKMMDAEAI